MYINRRAEPFNVKLKVEWRKNAFGDISIDDIKFANCSLPEPAPSCSQDHFLCRVTKACITRDKVCDFTDDCGDGSDEVGCDSDISNYR